MSKKVAYLSIGIAATLWGVIGLFVTRLYALGFTPTQIVTLRALTATCFLTLYALVKNRQLFRIAASDSRYFVGTGVVSFVLFNWCMFNAIRDISISVATILLYTAPAFVTILSRLFFKETLTPRKLLALLITLTGCTFVIGVLPNNNEPVSSFGLLLGLGSGFFYALYSVFGKYALQKYDSITVTLYTFVFAAVAITPFSQIWQATPLLTNPEAWLYIIGLGFFSTTLSFLLYTKGLHYIESSRASIMATIEPVVASLVGLLIFQEKLSFWQYIGITMVIAAVVLVQERSQKKAGKKAVAPASQV